LKTHATFWRWAAIGLATAVFLVWAQANAVGGLAGLLQVGEVSAVRPIIEGQLGTIPLADGPGHDGQIYYAIGLDLGGDEVGPLLDHAAYRYRRILLPLVASGFGLLDGHALLYGLVAVGVASMAVSAGLVAAMASRAGRSELIALVILLNPGMWLSVQLITSDALAVAFMLTGLHALTRGAVRSNPIWFALSALSKDVFLTTPVSLGVASRRWATVAYPTVAMGLWMAFLTLRLEDGFASRGNLDWPFLGLIEATANWANLDNTEWVYLIFALGSVVAGVVFGARRSWLRWPIAAWTALALVSSNWVWDFGNNAARAFAPIAVMVGLSYLQPDRLGTADLLDDARSGAT
jgi:hypothetical protein